ncbi:phosphoenolpyruvate carboxykinase [GTP] [Planctomycetota bacterium]|nr:phosphoenolpyruvate carboxykinase [GTP] [Planctomycetota bacterium]
MHTGTSASTTPAIPAAATPTRHPGVLSWVAEMAALCGPERIHWCDGSATEKVRLTERAIADGVLLRLNQDKLPGCYYHRSHPSDVARVEDRTLICTATKDEAGPTNNWADPDETTAKLHGIFKGSMAGRTMYVVPYLMGPPGCPKTKIGIELTDSVYVALSMRVMTRMGAVAWRELGETGTFNKGLHGMGTIDPEKRWIAHFPQRNEIISVNSNYGGNVLLGKKCLALRLGSWLGRQEGWLAEHMLIMKVESPTGEVTFVAAAFPSACGKTNFAMLIPPERYAGWKITTVGDDIAWLWPGEDGRLYAMNPENGYFGVAPGTNATSNPNALATISHDTIYTNVALTADLDVWWEGKTAEPPVDLHDWLGHEWNLRSESKAAQPNSRFAAPMINNPALAPEVNDPRGVPISAIIFGGRRATTFPLVMQAFNWSHGVYLGATMGSETTAAAVGATGQVRRDPMAMLPFCGYHMGDYFAHWLSIGKKLAHPPRFFHVNWFRRDKANKFLWPGFGENMRVLEWIVNRCHGHAEADETALGWMPPLESLDLRGLTGPGQNSYSRDRLAEAQAIDPVEWTRELDLQKELFDRIGERMPKELYFERELLRSRLGL